MKYYIQANFFSAFAEQKLAERAGSLGIGPVLDGIADEICACESQGEHVKSVEISDDFL